MDNYCTFLIVLIISSIWISRGDDQIATVETRSSTAIDKTVAPPACVTNGRFADPSDPCAQAYVICLWTGSQFLVWKMKCPNQLVFYQITSTCVRPKTPLPSTCLLPGVATEAPVPTSTLFTTPSTIATTISSVPTSTVISTPATPSCITNGRFADPSDPCGQTYVLCSWDGTQFLMWTLKCPDRLVFYQITSECVLPTTPIPSTCVPKEPISSPVPTPEPTSLTISSTIASTIFPTTETIVSSVPTTATTVSSVPTTTTTVSSVPTTATTVSSVPTTTTTVSSVPTTTTTVSSVPTTATTVSSVPSTTTIVSSVPTTTVSTTTIALTTAATSCTTNGRFSDPSDPCGQAYILCSWNGSRFLMTRLKCPNKLVFNQSTSKCVRPTTSLPSTC